MGSGEWEGAHDFLELRDTESSNKGTQSLSQIRVQSSFKTPSGDLSGEGGQHIQAFVGTSPPINSLIKMEAQGLLEFWGIRPQMSPIKWMRSHYLPNLGTQFL